MEPLQNWMIFLLNHALSAGFVTLAVLLVRLLLRRAPKRLTCFLWAAVALRLVLPSALSSSLSLVPSGRVIPKSILYADSPAVQTGIPALNDAVNPLLSSRLAPSPEAVGNPVQTVLLVLGIVWLAGAVGMAVYALVRSLLWYRRTAASVQIGKGVYLCDSLPTPFLLGFFRPRIYLPSSIPEAERAQALLHERAHLKRGDHLLKPLAYLLLCVYWFQPLLWAAFLLFCRDLEFACDERVIASLEKDARADYSEALLRCAAGKHGALSSPLAFGEIGVKARVRSVLSYRRSPVLRIIAASLLLAVVAVCFLTDPVRADPIGTIRASSSEDLREKGNPLLPDADAYLLRTQPDADAYLLRTQPYAAEMGLENYTVRSQVIARGVKEEEYGNADNVFFYYTFCLYGYPTQERYILCLVVDRETGEILSYAESTAYEEGTYSSFLPYCTGDELRSAEEKLKKKMKDEVGEAPNRPQLTVRDGDTLQFTCEMIVPITTPASLLGQGGCDIDHRHLFFTADAAHK